MNNRKPARRLTDAMIDRLPKPPKGEQVFHPDATKAFGVRVSYSGTKTFIVHTKVLCEGKWKDKRVLLGRYPALLVENARKKAEEAKKIAAAGEDPAKLNEKHRQQLEEKSRNTFGAVRDQFMKRYVCSKHTGLKPQSIKNYRDTLKSSDLASWENRPIGDISKRDIHELLDSVTDRGAPYVANRLFASLRKMMNWAAERDIIVVPPTAWMSAPNREVPRDRVLTDDEIRLLWKAFDNVSQLFAPIYKLLLILGQRKGEVSGMRLSELQGLNTDNPTWEIPGARTKNGKPHLVPLPALAIDIIKGAPTVGDLVFTTNGSTPVSGFSKVEKDLYSETKKLKEEFPDCFAADWRPHDLRRTVVTKMNDELGVLPHVVEAVVNHISGQSKAGVAGNYNRANYLKDRRQALNAWAGYLQEIIRGKKNETLASLLR